MQLANGTMLISEAHASVIREVWVDKRPVRVVKSTAMKHPARSLSSTNDGAGGCPHTRRIVRDDGRLVGVAIGSSVVVIATQRICRPRANGPCSVAVER